jgi:hypothetical protein
MNDLYFTLSDELPSKLSPYQICMLECLFHTFRVGVYLLNDKQELIGLNTRAEELCQKYVEWLTCGFR